MKKHKNIPLANFTSLRVGGPAKELIELEDNDDLLEIVKSISNELWIFGGGTNSLISDEGLPGTVIINNSSYIRLKDDVLTADSGANWDEVVKFAIKHELYGLELMSGIPGSTGAAIVGNIAAYGQKIADTFVSAEVYDKQTKATKTLKPADMKFDYRTSSLANGKHDYIILSASFELSESPITQLEYESALNVATELKLVPHSLKDRRAIIMETRKRAGSLLTKDGHATAGSFFKNPLVNEEQVDSILEFDESVISKEKLLRQNKLHSGDSVRVSAAHVLLAAGFRRGQTWGNVRLHPDHILKIENTGKATAQEIHDVVHFITGTVRSRLNIKLEPEVRFIGNFN